MHGCEMHDKAWMLGEPSGDLLAMMRTDVVTHEMNRPDVLGNLLVHMFQKGDAFLLPFKLPRQFGAVPLGEATAQPIGAFTGQTHDVNRHLWGKNRPWHHGQGRLRARPGVAPESVWPTCGPPAVARRPPEPRRIGSDPAARRRIIFPRRTSSAATVVDRCQRSKVACSSGDRSMRNDDLRPRAIITSSSRAKGGHRKEYRHVNSKSSQFGYPFMTSCT